MIKVIAFDFGNVIYKLHNESFIKKLERYSPLGHSKLFKEVFNSDEYELLEVGKISFDKYFRAMKKKTKLKMPKERFIKEINGRLNEIPSTLELIVKLKSRFKLILVSNANQINFVNVISKSKAFKHFNEKIISYKLGYKKPSFMIYLELIRVAGVEPSQILFIDDKKSNVKGASKLGINAVQYKNYNQLLKGLRRFKIKM